MTGKMFMRADEVAEALDVSQPYAYKLIRQLNGELKKRGCITIGGRIAPITTAPAAHANRPTTSVWIFWSRLCLAKSVA